MFSNKLREMRKLVGLSQQEIADKLFLSQQAYAKYENNTATPNPETLKLIAELLGVSVDYLLEVKSSKSDCTYKIENNIIFRKISMLSNESKIELYKYIELLSIKEMYIKK